MCLDTVYRGKQKRAALAKLPESGYYWKAVKQINTVFYPIYKQQGIPYKTGMNTTKAKFDKYANYRTGYHLYRNRNDANTIVYGGGRKSVRCKISKNDIVAIGKNNILIDNGLSIVTTRFWCPKPKGVKK